jgi:hypothetical protein
MARTRLAVEPSQARPCSQGAKSNLWLDGERAVFRDVPDLTETQLHDFSLHDVGHKFVKQTGSKHHLIILPGALPRLLAGEKKRAGDCALVFSDLTASKTKGKGVDMYWVYRCDPKSCILACVSQRWQASAERNGHAVHSMHVC